MPLSEKGRVVPRYPIFIPSKGRPDKVKAAELFESDGVPYQIVVEPQDFDHYAAIHGDEKLVCLDFNDKGLDYARNWIKGYAEDEAKASRHWQIDDDVRRIVRNYKGKRIKCPAGAAFAAIEDFTDRYENVALSGVRNANFGGHITKPFQLNNMVFQVMLIRSDLPYKFDCPGIEDADMSLQVISGGWCTVTLNLFQFEVAKQSGVGGQTVFFDPDERLTRARNLQRRWPGIVKITERNGMLQYQMGSRVWGKFDTPLKLRDGVDLTKLAAQGDNEYGMKLEESPSG